jgi:hypothetical protein
MVHQMCRPLVGWFMDAAVLSGALDLTLPTGRVNGEGLAIDQD